MVIVTVKKKYQVVVPEAVRDVIGVRVGDTFEVTAARGKIIFSPKAVVVVSRKSHSPSKTQARAKTHRARRK